MKKHLFRAILLLFTVVFALALASCDKDKPETPEETKAPAGTGIDLSKYTLMRSDTASKTVSDAMSEFRRAIRTTAEIELPVGTDFEMEGMSTRAEYEIIIGHTKIEEENRVFETLNDGEYAIKIVGTKIVIVGKDDSATLEGVRYFCEKYLHYGADRYKNEAIGTTVISLEEEVRHVETYTVERDRTPLTPLTSDPIEINGKNFTFAGCREEDGRAHIADNIAWIISKEKTEPGPYSVQAHIEITRGRPTMQFSFNIGSDGYQALINITGNGTNIVRRDYERGGASFEGSPDDFVIRADVYPNEGFFRYFINDVMIGEVICGPNDYPLLDESAVQVAAVGSDFECFIDDVYMESIDDVERRYYHMSDVTYDNENLYPKSENKPADTIYVVEAKGLSDDSLFTLLTLQGNVNRTTPRIFIDYRKYNNDPHYAYVENETVYLELLEAKGRTLVKSTVEELLVLFKDEYKGVIFGDAFDKNNFEENIITSLCGIMDGVYMTESQYKKLKDDIQKDILFRTNGKFTDSVDAYMWVWEHYKDQFTKQAIFHMPVGRDGVGHQTTASRDYAVMSRAFVFCTTDVKNAADHDFYMSLFASTAPNTGILGQGGGLYGEFEMFTMCGRFGKYFTYSFSTPNLSLFNSLEVGELKQKEAKPVSLEKNTMYVCYDFSEGDNLSWDYHLWMKEYYDVEKREMNAKGYTLSASLYYVAPAIMEYYYQNATENDYFVFDGGGISNLGCPDEFADMYYEKDAIMDRMLEIMNYVCEKADVHVLRALHNISDEMAERYDAEVPELKMLLSSYGQTTYQIGGYGGDFKNALKVIGEDLVRGRSAFSTFRALAPLVPEMVKAQKNADGIYFGEVFVYGNGVMDNMANLNNFKAELESAGMNVVVVRPDTFADLYLEYCN